MNLRQKIGQKLAVYLARPRKNNIRTTTSKPELLESTLRKGDVLLVEGSSHFSTAIKYLTQSTWSHAALCIKDPISRDTGEKNDDILLEVDVSKGVQIINLSDYWNYHTRICRPVGLTNDEIDDVINFASKRNGSTYDLKNIFDLARYLIRTPPVPTSMRRKMLSLGSGDPTKAICSSLIAEAFQSIKYPILPEIYSNKKNIDDCDMCHKEYFHIRHHSLYVPRDYDISPYFSIIKPAVEQGFDYKKITWKDNIRIDKN